MNNLYIYLIFFNRAIFEAAIETSFNVSQDFFFFFVVILQSPADLEIITAPFLFVIVTKKLFFFFKKKAKYLFLLGFFLN
jgi:hypothetical protein